VGPLGRIGTLAALGALMWAGAEASTARQRQTHVVTRATSEVTVDGTLDEPAWRDALRLRLEYEVQPGDNVPPPVSTEVLLTYDERSLLVGVRAHDPEPGLVRAHYSDRDQLWGDDWIGIALDTFDDQRRAFEFTCNPLGIQMDAVNDDAGGSYDTSWDAIWDSAGRLTADGWELEMRIPFSQLRFAPRDGPQVWGFDAFRSWPRDVRHHIGLWPRQRGANSYLAQADAIVGFEGVSPGRNLEVAPTLTASRTDRREELPDGPMVEGDVETEVGVTARWGVTTGLSLTAAGNPDFSQVEADAVQLDINEQFALYYPEKRPFFLEGADTFNTPVDLLYTRTVADPSVALKVSGKEGRHTFGVFTARDEVTNILVPGVDGSDGGSFDSASTATVARYRFDVGKGSTVGTMLTDREGEGGYHNRLLSVDGLWRPSPADSLTLNLATSATRYSEEMSQDLGLPEGELEDEAILVEYRHSERSWNGWARYRDYGDGFRADLGFVSRVGFRDLAVGGELIWWGEAGDLYTKLELGADASRTERQGGDLLEEEVEVWGAYEGPLQSSAFVELAARTYVFAGVDFDQVGVHVEGEVWPTGDLQLELEVDWGDWVDFEHVRPGTFTGVAPALSWRAGRHLSLTGSVDYTTLEVDGGSLYETRVGQLKAVYQFTGRTFLRAILQHADIRRDPDLWQEPVEERSRDLFSQLLFSYTVNPRTVLFVGASEGREGTDEVSLEARDRTLFVKLGYAWLW